MIPIVVALCCFFGGCVAGFALAFQLMELIDDQDMPRKS
jgi:hypothetical protein